MLQSRECWRIDTITEQKKKRTSENREENSEVIIAEQRGEY